MTESDERWMRRALRLAVLGREAAPNPMVGCVIVAPDGKKLGEGYHVRPGEPHAEVNALRKAGEAARGATAYVTLEPCSHFGRTPPCANALISAELARVVVAMTDPDARVCGKGIDLLRAAGIEVEVGVCETTARKLNEAYIKHRAIGLPLVTIKTAMTLDGKIATVAGESRWITSTKTRLWVHRQLRARNQAILVGVGTVLADDPTLTVRLSHRPDARNPLRMIVDSHLRTPLDSKVVSLAQADGATIIAHVDDPDNKRGKLSERGVRLIKCGTDAAGRVDLRDLIERLGNELGVIGVLVEGGAEISAGFFEKRLVDRYYCTIGPKIVGGTAAPGPVGGPGIAQTMAEAVNSTGISVRRSDLDIVVGCEFARMV